MLISFTKAGKGINIISHNWFLQIGCFKVGEAGFPGWSYGKVRFSTMLFEMKTIYWSIMNT